MDKRCKGCKWAEIDALANTVCLNLESKHWLAEGARIDENDCGPSGRYWEPREGKNEPA